MTPNLNSLGWIHIFTVTDSQTHKKGFTIYKITSVVFPRAVPQALTCLTVWRRFHDVKRLHRDLQRKHKSLNLAGQLPEPTDCSFFKRFDAAVIQRRKEYILQLLDFAAQHTALYKCHAFAQFFNDAQQTGGTLTPITTPLHDFSNGDSTAIEKRIFDKRILHVGDELLDTAALDDKPDCISNNDDKQATDVSTTSSEEPFKKPSKDYTRFLTPMASIENDDSDYIYEAALEFSRAVQAEVNQEYDAAHLHYKCGVEILLHGSKDDTNEERKFIAKAKITKYLARADDIYDKFLRENGSGDCNATTKTNFQLSIDITDASGASDATAAIYLERPWNHLAKYKVLQVLGERVLQVQSITEPQRPVYVMKGIEKPSSNTPTQTIFLPQHVPYMVELHAFFQSEQKIFLLLRQAEGGRLYDYVRTYAPNSDKTNNFATLFPELDVAKEQETVAKTTNLIRLAPTDTTEFSELVRCSQQLLQSVSHTLKEVQELREQTSPPPAAPNATKAHEIVRIPEASLKQWARELAVAIESLHGKGVILGDLHMDNLLLGSKGQLLLTYFYQNEGHFAADNYVHKAHSVQALAGHFVAPERPLTFKSDWWSYGIVLYQLLLGVPFQAAHPGNIDLYGCVQYPECVEISDCARDLLDNLLQQAPEQRFDFEQLKAHAFYSGTNWLEVQRNGTNQRTLNTANQKVAGNYN